MNTTLRNLLITCAALLVLGGGAYAYRHSHGDTSSVDSNASTTSQTLSDGTVINGLPEGAVVNEVDVSATAPDYERPLAFSITEDFSPEVKTALNAQLKGIQSSLEKNKTDYQAWISLGLIRKMAGDYTGAEVVWTYVTEIYPKESIAYENLGNLYLDFIKNYPKAETNFKQAIALNAGDITAYESLFALYTTYGYKSGTSAASDLLAAGLKANPGNEVLLQMQAQLNK